LGNRIPSAEQKAFVEEHILLIRKQTRYLVYSCSKKGNNIWYRAGLPMDLDDLEQEVILQILTGTPYDPLKPRATPGAYIASVADTTLKMLVRKLGNKKRRDAIASLYDSISTDDISYEDNPELFSTISDDLVDEYLYSSGSADVDDGSDNFINDDSFNSYFNELK
jgi:DNA-directed RNA polymerase specialized sigma24 family protein